MEKTKITKESLLQYGMQEIGGESKIFIPMKKVLSSHFNGGDEGEIAIAVTNIRNRDELCLLLPDGSCIYLNIKNIEELKTFENCIQSFEPNY